MTQFANMTLDDLKTGMIVTLRNGYEYTVIRDRVADGLTDSDIMVRIDDEDRGWMKVADYNMNLTYHTIDDDEREWDIVKVERGNHPFQFMNLNYRKDNRVLLWEALKRVKLTIHEIENRLGYKIEIVSDKNGEE